MSFDILNFPKKLGWISGAQKISSLCPVMNENNLWDLQMAKVILMRKYSQNKGVMIQAKKYWARALSGLALAKWHGLNFLDKMLSTFWLAKWNAWEQIKPSVVLVIHMELLDTYFFVAQIFFVWKKEKLFVGSVIESLSQSANWSKLKQKIVLVSINQ